MRALLPLSLVLLWSPVLACGQDVPVLPEAPAESPALDEPAEDAGVKGTPTAAPAAPLLSPVVEVPAPASADEPGPATAAGDLSPREFASATDAPLDLPDLAGGLAADAAAAGLGYAVAALAHRHGRKRASKALRRATPLVAAGVGGAMAGVLAAVLVAPPAGVALAAWVAGHALAGALGAVGLRPIGVKALLGRLS